jgi:integrase/recombinase XerD
VDVEPTLLTAMSLLTGLLKLVLLKIIQWKKTVTPYAINALQRTSDLMALGHYSELTRKHYLQELRFLFCYYPDVRPSQISYQMAVDYLVYLKVKCKMASQSFGFFFKKVLGKPYRSHPVLFAAHQQKLPAVMTQEQMRKVLDTICNVKHRTLLSLMYSTGMRLSEIVNLKIEEVDSKQMLIRITAGKGNKDRYVPLSPMLLQELRLYFIQYRPERFLFNGAGKGRKYAPRTIQRIMQLTLMKAGLQNKNYSIHTIRHSFATHLLDNGTDLQAIQQLMGHQHINPTVHYLHLSTKRLQNIVNPYDVLMQTQL